MKEDWISSSMTTDSIRSACATAETLDPRLGVDERVLGVLLDELAPGLDVLAHQHREHPVGGGSVLERDPQQVPARRVHRGLPELLGLHLREPLEPLDVHLLLPVLAAELLEVAVGLQVRDLPLGLHAV